jgi:hypothetical protein
MEKIEINHSGILKKILHYRTHQGHINIDIENIKHCSGCRNRPMTIISVEDFEPTLPPSHTISEVEKVLSEGYFIRCHRSWLINIKKASSICISKKLIVMQDGLLIPISRGKLQEVFFKALEFNIPDKKLL